MKSWRIFSGYVFAAVLFVSVLLAAPLSAGTAEEITKEDGAAEKNLVEQKCSSCHGIDRVYAADKDHAEWTQTVEKMMRYSTKMNFLNQQEKETVIEYLANRNRSQPNQ
ncbi:MAG: hypothetical protein ACL93V_05525 [Candidatus Electrothrix sp. YB6]